MYWGTSSSGTLRSGSPSPGAVRYTQLRYTLQIQWGTPYKYSEVHPAEVQWGTPSWGAVSGRSASHANLRPVTALHCARLLDSTLEILWIVWIVWYLHFCLLALHSSWKRIAKQCPISWWGMHDPLNSAENWNVHFSQKGNSSNCPAGKLAVCRCKLIATY